MLGIIAKAGKFAASLIGKTFGFNVIKNFIDAHHRTTVTPIEGSVLYCDLYGVVKHSGVYVGDDNISNIVVHKFLESTVKLSSPDDFTTKSLFKDKIYVSCDSHRTAVGDFAVSDTALARVGEQSFYGLVIKNCHQFSSKCVQSASHNPNLVQTLSNNLLASLFDGEWEFTIADLKKVARNKLNATKWLLWDYNNSAKDTQEPDWQAQNEFFKNQALTPEFIEKLREELAQLKDYQQEISDENIPNSILARLEEFGATLSAVSDKYDEMQGLLVLNKGCDLSYNDFMACQDTDFSALARELANNSAILDLTHKMGRNYVSETQKKQIKVPVASKNEMHGTHLSDDIIRLLPSELMNLEDETLENLFYARLLEKNLLTYELRGKDFINDEIDESYERQITGPVVACVDTSASMSGQPLLKAKAVLFAIAGILKQEQRRLYVILFGSSGQIKSYELSDTDGLAGLLQFLQGGFAGGTDFETPLNKALNIIEQTPNYKKADILMLSDGDCALSPSFQAKLDKDKQRLNCTVYSVLCDGARGDNSFADETVVL